MLNGFTGTCRSRLLASAALLLVLSACAMAPQPFTEAELKNQAATDRGQMFEGGEPVSKPLSLADAISRSLKYNLDHRTKVMEQVLALGQTDLDRWDLLPKVAADAGYVGRSDHATTTSRDSVTLQPALSNPYYSTDRDRLTADLGVSWNILDFGVSYFNARQNADRALIAEEHRRKTAQNLVQEVRSAYWRAAAAQVLEADVLKAVNEAEGALTDAKRVEAAGLKNPADTLRFEKTLLESLRQLELIAQELSTAKVELAALLNLPPGSNFTLDVPPDTAMAVPTIPLSVERVEEIAFVHNPDLHEQGYLSRIAVDETRKTIIRLLPGINLSASQQFDSNSFLVDNLWYEAGARVSWNLINLLSLPDQLDHADAGEKLATTRRLALRMAVLAQVHISYRQFLNAGRQFERADDLYKVENRLARFTQIRADNDAQSVLERIGNQTSAIAAALRRYQTYAQAEQALGRVYATMGQDLLPPSLTSHDLATVSAAVARGLEAWDRGEVMDVSAEQAVPPASEAAPVIAIEVAPLAAPPAPSVAAPAAEPIVAPAIAIAAPPAVPAAPFLVPPPAAVAPVLIAPPAAVAPVLIAPPAAVAPVLIAPPGAAAPILVAPASASVAVPSTVADESRDADTVLRHVKALVAQSGGVVTVPATRQ